MADENKTTMGKLGQLKAATHPQGVKPPAQEGLGDRDGTSLSKLPGAAGGPDIPVPEGQVARQTEAGAIIVEPESEQSKEAGKTDPAHSSPVVTPIVGGQPKGETEPEAKDPIRPGVESDKPAAHANFEMLEAFNSTLPEAPVVRGFRTVDTLDAESANKFLNPTPDAHASGETLDEETDVAPKPLGIYTCLPIKTWDVGRFVFTNGQLQLTSQKDVEEFEKLRNAMPIGDKIRIRKIDISLAEVIARGTIPRAVKGFDSGVSAEEDELRRQNPKVGTQNLGTKDSGN